MLPALLGLALLLGTQTSRAWEPDPEPDPIGRILFTQVPLQVDGEPTLSSIAAGSADLPDGSRVVLYDPFGPGASLTTVLTPGFAAAGRPDPSFDGKRMLFVGRRAPGDPLNVWELELDGGEPRQVTHLEQSVPRAIYLSSLYTLDAAAPERRIAYCVDDGSPREPGVACAALYTARMDGSGARQITYNPYGVSDPFLLSDGRLLYVGGRPPEAGGGTALFTVHPDGTDLSAFAAVHGPAAVRAMPWEMDHGWVRYIETAKGEPAHGGALVSVRRARSLVGSWTNAAYRTGDYRSPSGFPGGRMIVSFRPGEFTYGIHELVRFVDGPAPLYDDPTRHDIDAVAIGAREMPAGRSSVVDDRHGHGYLYCLDAYLSDRKGAREIEPGSISTLRIFEATWPEGAGAGATTEKLLGEVPVRPDGSFYIRVPARRPLRLETLDDAGRLLQAMENWIWVMPNEQRGCIGCHENRERTPPNRHPLALHAQPVDVGLPPPEVGDEASPHGGGRE